MNTSRANSAPTTVLYIHDAPASTPEQEMAMADEKVADDLLSMRRMIHRLPKSLKGIGGADGRYTTPNVVAIGPYHRCSEDVRNMEEVKRAAAHLFCKRSGLSTEEVCDRLRSVAGDARHCYTADDKAVKDMSDEDFVRMLFVDGCFLLQFMADGKAKPFLSRDMLSRHGIVRDMMLLENQIPWLVLEELIKFTRTDVDVRDFVARVGDKLLPEKNKKEQQKEKQKVGADSRSRTSRPKSYQEYSPAHLLDLLLKSQLHRMSDSDKGYEGRNWSARSSSAIEVEQMGVRLSASTERWIGNMSFKANYVFGELSLSPVFLNDFSACWLVNLAAHEMIVDAPDWPKGFVVNAYLSVFAMLMDRQEDVRKLRVKRLLQGTFSDTQVLAFFDGLANHLSYAGRYFALMDKIDDYRETRPMRTFVHRFLNKGYQAITIATLGSIAGMLVGIFKTLLSKKMA